MTRQAKFGSESPVALVEKFLSVQGEGANVGRAAFFVRFAGCNLDCVFADGSICDTPWRKARIHETVSSVLSWIKYTPATKPIVIITGGEPTMAPSFDDLVLALQREGHYVAVESNGTLWRDSLEYVDWLVVSPKDKVDHAKPLHQPGPENAFVLGGIHEKVLLLPPHEYRYVITGWNDDAPQYHPADAHFVSPAMESDGLGKEWHQGIVPKFVVGAVERCIEIVQADPRWRLSLQVHKWMLAR